MMGYKHWTYEEVKHLKSLYPNFRVKDLVNKFPDRNADTIVAKALNLGLASAKLWQPEEDYILRKYFTNAAKEVLSMLLSKRSLKAIIARGERLGLKRKRDKPRLTVKEDYFTHWSGNMSYVLGFILADGCIIRGTYKGYSDSLKFGVQLSDINILEKIKKEFNSDHKISVVKNAAHFCISSQVLVNDLKRLGISYRKSLNETLPNVPVEYKRDFIRGVIDGDGGIMIDKTGYPVIGICGGWQAITFIRNHFLEKLEVYSKVGRRSYSIKYKNFLYEIRYKSNTALKILSYVYNGSSLYLDRKYKLAKKCLRIKIRERRNINRRYADD